MSVAAAFAPSRRAILASGVAGGFVLAFHVPVANAGVVNDVEGVQPEPGPFAPNAFIRIDTTGKTTLVMPQVEMGQGVYTSIPMILAEELDADWNAIALEHAPANEKLYANPVLTVQATGNSNSVRAFWMPLRKAAAQSRALLVAALDRGGNADEANALRQSAPSGDEKASAPQDLPRDPARPRQDVTKMSMTSLAKLARVRMGMSMEAGR